MSGGEIGTGIHRQLEMYLDGPEVQAERFPNHYTLVSVFGGLRPVIACLCGSSRFYDQYQQAYYDLTMRGEIVLSVGFYPHATAEHGHGEGVGHDSEQKVLLDELHLRKIDLADYVVVVSDATGYFGASTTREIRYALDRGKPVAYLEKAALLCAQRAGLTGQLPVPGLDGD